MPRSRSFDPQSRVFDKLVFHHDVPDDSGTGDCLTVRHWRNIKLRDELVAIVGSELDLELAIRRSEGEPVRVTAELLRLDPSTVTRRGEKALRFLHCGILAKLICVSLRRKHWCIASLQKVKRYKADETGFVVALPETVRSFDLYPAQQPVAGWIQESMPDLRLAHGSPDNGRRPLCIFARRDGEKSHFALASVVHDFSTACELARENGCDTVFHIALERDVAV